MTLLTACGGGDGGPAAVCVPGERTCDEAGTGVQVCTEDGTGFEPLETCIAGASCQEGSCACPGGQVTGAEACLSVGVLDCPPWAPPDGDGICTPEVPQCGAGQSPALDLEGGCVAVGVETCPEGWERLADATCSPVLPGCGEGQLATFDGACTVTGPADDCGTAGPFGNLEGDAGAVWVAADSPGATATGSRAMPFPTIVEALDVVPDGGTVLVGSGVYPGGLHIDRPVHIRGRCATEVTIQGAASVTLDTWGDIPMEALMVVQETGGVELAGLTLDDGVTVKGQRAVGLLAVGSPGLLLRDLRVLHAGG
ncbi:MAG: hypothetical protein FJ098_13225, partial [Deltaproteobacteria bacterium]|nr:hypothetical protein [Deltaproteobacteria bacterium]